MYFENARATTTSTLQFTIATGGTWKIKIAQIECSSTSRAYPDCDQFVTGITGSIRLDVEALLIFHKWAPLVPIPRDTPRF